jgi:hypothetical protein
MRPAGVAGVDRDLTNGGHAFRSESFRQLVYRQAGQQGRLGPEGSFFVGDRATDSLSSRLAMAKVHCTYGAKRARWAATLGLFATALATPAARAQSSDEAAAVAPTDGATEATEASSAMESGPATETTGATQPGPGAGATGAAQSQPATRATGATQPQPAECTPPCRPGFVCSNGQCVGGCNPPCPPGYVCSASLQCVSEGMESPLPEYSAEAEAERRDISLIGIRGFGGVVVGGGASLHSWTEDSDALDRPTPAGAFLFAVRAGLFVNQSEISVEVAPQTYLPIIGEDRDEARPIRRDMIDDGHGTTGFLGNYAYHISMARGAYWPLRIGGGFIYRTHEVPTPFATTDFQGRLDLFNISVKTRFLLLDFSFPSARYATDFDQYHRFTGLFTAAASYVSP